MKKLIILLFVSVSLAVPVANVLANTVYTSSFGCSWQGGTYVSSGLIQGYTAEDLPYDCSSQVVLQFHYKLNGICYYGSWQSASSWYIGNSHSGSGGASDHQIYVPGYGYGQWQSTYYPWEGIC